MLLGRCDLDASSQLFFDWGSVSRGSNRPSRKRTTNQPHNPHKSTDIQTSRWQVPSQLEIDWSKTRIPLDTPPERPKNPRGRPKRLRLYPGRDTTAQKQARKRDLESLADELSLLDQLRPQTRGECHPIRNALVAHLPDDDQVKKWAPCPFVSCKYHLHFDIDDGDGSITEIPIGLNATCSLDIADQGGLTRQEISNILQVSEDRTRFFEAKLLKTIRDEGWFDDFKPDDYDGDVNNNDDDDDHDHETDDQDDED